MDIILYNILVAICCFLIGYFFGAFPTSIVIGKVFFNQDPRDYGSKNAGGTNSGRLWGKKVGFIIIVLDMLKTIAPIWICWAILTFIPLGDKALMPTAELSVHGLTEGYIVEWPAYWIAPFGCLIGHCWPVFAQFKGGKGVSNFQGTVCGTSWLLGFLPGFFYFLNLKLTKMVSLTGIIQGCIISLFFWIWAILRLAGVIPADISLLPSYGPTLEVNWVAAIVVTLMAGIMIWRHHENIARIKAGTERKITWMK